MDVLYIHATGNLPINKPIKSGEGFNNTSDNGAMIHGFVMSETSRASHLECDI